MNWLANLAVTFFAVIGSSCANEIEKDSTVIPCLPIVPTVSTLMVFLICSITVSRPERWASAW